MTDAAEAQAGIEFAKKFELIKSDESKRLRLQEVDLSDESSIAEALPRLHFPPALPMPHLHRSLCLADIALLLSQPV